MLEAVQISGNSDVVYFLLTGQVNFGWRTFVIGVMKQTNTRPVCCNDLRQNRRESVGCQMWLSHAVPDDLLS